MITTARKYTRRRNNNKSWKKKMQVQQNQLLNPFVLAPYFIFMSSCLLICLWLCVGHWNFKWLPNCSLPFSWMCLIIVAVCAGACADAYVLQRYDNSGNSFLPHMNAFIIYLPTDLTAPITKYTSLEIIYTWINNVRMLVGAAKFSLRFKPTWFRSVKHGFSAFLVSRMHKCNQEQITWGSLWI